MFFALLKICVDRARYGGDGGGVILGAAAPGGPPRSPAPGAPGGGGRVSFHPPPPPAPPLPPPRSVSALSSRPGGHRCPVSPAPRSPCSICPPYRPAPCTSWYSPGRACRD